MQINVNQIETSANDAKVFVEFYKQGCKLAETIYGGRKNG